MNRGVGISFKAGTSKCGEKGDLGSISITYHFTSPAFRAAKNDKGDVNFEKLK